MRSVSVSKKPDAPPHYRKYTANNLIMLAQAGYANAKRNHDLRAEETFREVARRNVVALTSASLQELRNARSMLGSR
jgi:hypothetical protein